MFNNLSKGLFTFINIKLVASCAWTQLAFTFFTLLLSFNAVLAQDCDLTIRGYVSDLNTTEPIAAVNILVQEEKAGVVTDSTGYFQVEGICAKDYHLVVSHIGCETQYFFLEMRRDTTVHIFLDHHDYVLHDVEIVGSANTSETQVTEVLKSKEIVENPEQNLSGLLENISGVSSLKNGTGIAKPVVHGLYGNRLIVLNNGLAQSGQQWGNDHALEIDPLAAEKIKVVKGAGALEYPGNATGAVILIEPGKINPEPHLHGRAGAFFMTNGRGFGSFIQAEKYKNNFGRKLSVSFKKSGDRHTPDYFLRNTGSQEINAAIQLEKKWGERQKIEAYLSTFNTELGVLRGAHIGNLTDLENAFMREIPFFTKDEFTYQIEAPKQKVHHHLAKVRSVFFLNNTDNLEFTYGGQWNIRKEFDVRRSGRSDIPALSLSQFTHFVEGKYIKELAHDWQLKTGLQLNYIDNANKPETGILPLIPDYNALESGLFLGLTKVFGRFTSELSGRFDYTSRNVKSISRDLPRRVLNLKDKFSNPSAAIGLSYKPSTFLSFAFNSAYVSRKPGVNELYSFGLHQGVSGIEEGTPDLNSENSFKTVFSAEGRIRESLFFSAVLYRQDIRDYIYLEPQNEFRLTIRGAFPVFKYARTDARISGLDLSLVYNITPAFTAQLGYSHINGKDIERDAPLIFVPSDKLTAQVVYQIPHIKKVENIELEIGSRYVFEQTDLLAEQDFLPAPSAYFLLNARVAAEAKIAGRSLCFYLKADNLLNTTYRDYLNRQRYFADDIGRNIVVGVNFKI